MACCASACDAATTTPLPAAKPSALITTGESADPNSPLRRCAITSAGESAVRNAAVGTPCLAINSFAKILLPSKRAAMRVGPTIGKLFASNRSTMPAASGASGPTKVRSIPSDSTKAASCVCWSTGIFTSRATCAMPAFPGAQNSSTAAGDVCRRAQRIACSRPPEPMTSSFLTVLP